jgi:hypothetical protein
MACSFVWCGCGCESCRVVVQFDWVRRRATNSCRNLRGGRTMKKGSRDSETGVIWPSSIKTTREFHFLEHRPHIQYIIGKNSNIPLTFEKIADLSTSLFFEITLDIKTRTVGQILSTRPFGANFGTLKSYGYLQQLQRSRDMTQSCQRKVI